MKKAYLIIILATLSFLATFPRPGAAQVRHEVATGGQRWPGSHDGFTYIPVCWENGSGYSTQTETVKNAIRDSWELAADVRFQGWGQCAASSRGIRILIKDNRSNVKDMGYALNGRPGGMELNFTFENFAPNCKTRLDKCIQAIAVHEFGHALGLAHEQDHPQSICKQDVSPHIKAVKVTVYDPLSVMNYCNENWMDGLSQLDREGIAIIYGKRSDKTGYIDFSNTLGPDQNWEEISVTFGGAEKSFTVNKNQTANSMRIPFTGSGRQCFDIRTKASHTDSKIYEGKGQSCLDLVGGQNYSMSFIRKSWNPAGYYDIALK